MSSPPSAASTRLRLRAETFARIRDFFKQRNVLEVDTPAFSRAGTSDPSLSSIAATIEALGGTHYLHTSPEYAMKRLLSENSGDIYQLCRVFRDDELGRWHQPEFVMLEWYRLGLDEFGLMDDVHDLLNDTLGQHLQYLRRFDLSYAEAFEAHVQFDPHRVDAAAQTELAAILVARGISPPGGLSLDGMLDLALTTQVVPQFDPNAATFLYDYPATQAALAATKPTTPPVSARFEVFVAGVELGNGFRELTDAAEQRGRFNGELAARRAAGMPTPPIDERFLSALDSGLPACSGVAIGVDRLIALAAGATGLADCINFAHRIGG